MKKATLYICLVLLFLFGIVSFTVSGKALATKLIEVTPTFGCVANVPCTTPQSTATPTGSSPSSAQSTSIPSPTLDPCAASSINSTASHRHHKRHHKGRKNGYISKLIQWFMQLLEQLLKQLGISDPLINPNITPTPSGEPVPSNSVTNAPSINPCPSASIQPSTAQTNPSPTLFVTTAVTPGVTAGVTPASTTGLKFSDEFNSANGTLPDTSKWKAEVGAKIRNNEDQYYTPFSNKNAYTDGAGNLIIEARKESYSGSSFTSAALDSTYSQTYGRIEWRARMDSLQSGIWPALWTWGSNGSWPQGGELDMMEWFADPGNPVSEANIHASDSSTDHPWGGQKLEGVDITQWNVYSVEWRPAFVEFKVNGTRKAYIASAQWQQGWDQALKTPQMIIMNVAMNNGGVDWMSSNAKLQSSFTSAKMYVDYVRYYE